MLTQTLKLLYYPCFRVLLRIRCWLSDVLNRGQLRNGLPPALLRYRVSESLAIDEFRRVGRGCANLITEHLRHYGMELGSQARILDFGCGCGRLMSWLDVQYPDCKWHGVDVDSEAVDWCQAHLPRVDTRLISQDPPLPFDEGYFDAIYCLSVFTHLDEQLQERWLRALTDVLKPGGILLITVHGETAADAGLDEVGRRELHSHGFLHRSSFKLKGVVPDRYHTTWHTAEYITKKLNDLVGASEYIVVAGGSQDVVSARKR